MKRMLRTVAAAVATMAIAAGSIEACTAQSVMQDAMKLKGDVYRATRDVAVEFVDEEGFANDELTIEAGIGTLFIDVHKTSDGGKTADGWRAILDGPTCRPSCGTSVRAHMRTHVREWDDALKGKRPDLMTWWNKNYGSAPAGAPADSNTSPVDGRTEAEGRATPIDSPSAPAPSTAPAALPRAG